MRGITLRAVPVCFVAFACGCFLVGGDRAPDAGAAGPTATHTYWRQVGAVLAQKPAGGEMPELVALVRKQTDQLRELPTEGVDAELVAAVDRLIKSEEIVLDRAELVNNDPARLKASRELAQVFADANKSAADAKKAVRALQPALNKRHGGGFTALGG